MLRSLWGLLRWPGSKESACNARDPGLIPGVRRSPEVGNGNPLQYSCLENPMHRVSGSSDGREFPGGSDSKESACSAGDLGSVPGSGKSPGEGNGYPLQYSGLENSLDRGPWQAIVHGVITSWTWLCNFHFTFFQRSLVGYIHGLQRVGCHWVTEHTHIQDHYMVSKSLTCWSDIIIKFVS